MDRLVQIQYPDGSRESRRYTPLAVDAWDASEKRIRFELNADDRLKRSVNYIDGREVTTTYSYGPFTRLQSITDARGTVLDVLEYDSLGRRVRIVDADAGALEATYNAFGEVTSERNALGEVTRYRRDALGRPTEITDPAGRTIYEWDSAPRAGAGLALGAIATATAPDSTKWRFEYDANGRLTGKVLEVGRRTFSLRREFDAVGRVKVLHYPDGDAGAFSIEQVYGPDGRLKSIQERGTVLWEAQQHDAWGRRTLERLGNSSFIDRDYDSRSSRLVAIESYLMVPAGSPAPGLVKRPFQKLVYTYEPNGSLRSRTDHIADRTETFKYDNAKRLVSWSLTAAGRTEFYRYQYDDVGNLTRSTDRDGVHTFAHGAGAGPHAPTSMDSESLTYDALGRRVGGGDVEVVYTAFNLPERIRTAAGRTSFGYDAFRRRVTKHGPRFTTTYVGDVYERREGKETSHHFFIRAAGRSVAEVVDRGGTRTVRYLHRDHLGSTQVITDTRASVIGRRWYTPFGSIESGAPSDPSAHTGGFTGHEGDWAEGLVNMRGRIYDPRTRRFATPDPVVATPHLGASLNRYAYALNSPLSFVDRSGLSLGYAEDEDDSCSICDFEDHYVIVDQSDRDDQGEPPEDYDYQDDYGYDDGYVNQSYDDYGSHGGYSGQFDYDEPATSIGDADLSEPEASNPSSQPSAQSVYYVSVGGEIRFSNIIGTGNMWGLNLQLTQREGLSIYVVTPDRETEPVQSDAGYGVDAGVSLQGNVAITNEGWEGVFEAVEGGLGPYSGSYFWTDSGRTQGLSGGMGAGAPFGLAHTRASYQEVLNIIPGAEELGRIIDRYF